MYIGNGFDVVPHCKHFQPSASLLATANKGRTLRKFPVERLVRLAFELDWENSWVGTTGVCLSFTPAPPLPPSPSPPKCSPETAKSSSVPRHQQHPCRIIRRSEGKSLEQSRPSWDIFRGCFPLSWAVCLCSCICTSSRCIFFWIC